MFLEKQIGANFLMPGRLSTANRQAAILLLNARRPSMSFVDGSLRKLVAGMPETSLQCRPPVVAGYRLRAYHAIMYEAAPCRRRGTADAHLHFHVRRHQQNWQ